MKTEAEEMTPTTKELIKKLKNKAQEIEAEMINELKMKSKFNKMKTRKNQVQDKKKPKNKYNNKC